jgi:predicted PurR-regulated permease PerM
VAEHAPRRAASPPEARGGLGGARPRTFTGKVVTVAVVATIGAALYAARHGLVLVYLGFLIAIALSPVVRLVERWTLRPIGRIRLPRTVAILVVYLAIVVAIVGVGYLVVQPLVAQIDQFSRDLPALVDRLERFLVSHGLLDHRPSWSELFHRVPKEHLLGALKTTGLGVLGGVIGTVALVFLTFYLLVDSRTLFEEALRFVPLAERDRVREASRAVTHKVSAWLGGHILLGLIMGSSTALVLGLLGVPYFYVLAVLSFLGEFFPYVGALVSATLGILIALATSWTLAIEVLVFFVIQHQTENHVLVPQIFERQVGLSAATVIVAILLGSELLGILGIILAVPTAAIVQVVLEELVLGDER